MCAFVEILAVTKYWRKQVKIDDISQCRQSIRSPVAGRRHTRFTEHTCMDAPKTDRAPKRS